MQTYRCRCGDRVSFGSMPPDPCSGCDKCGSSLVHSALPFFPAEDYTPKPHDWVTHTVQTDEGPPKPVTRCRWCAKRKGVEGPAEEPGR